MTLDDIIKNLEEGNVPPQQLVEMLEWLGGTYGRMETQLNVVEKGKPIIWLELRKTCKSSVETDLKWEMTEHGMQEKDLKSSLKIISKLTPTVRSILKHKEYEIHNQA